MPLDSLNNPNNEFNEHIFNTLSNLNTFFMDPYIKYKPHKWYFMWKNRQSIHVIRNIGRKKIMERLEMIKNNQELPNDILTAILQSHGKLLFDKKNFV